MLLFCVIVIPSCYQKLLVRTKQAGVLYGPSRIPTELITHMVFSFSGSLFDVALSAAGLFPFLMGCSRSSTCPRTTKAPTAVSRPTLPGQTSVMRPGSPSPQVRSGHPAGSSRADVEHLMQRRCSSCLGCAVEPTAAESQRRLQTLSVKLCHATSRPCISSGLQLKRPQLCWKWDFYTRLFKSYLHMSVYLISHRCENLITLLPLNV